MNLYLAWCKCEKSTEWANYDNEFKHTRRQGFLSVLKRGFSWILNKPCFLGRTHFHHESHLRSPKSTFTEQRKVKIPNEMPFAAKLFVIFAQVSSPTPKNVHHKRSKTLTMENYVAKLSLVLSSLSFGAKLML